MSGTDAAGFVVATPNIPVVRFDPRKEGLERFLGSTEAMIMGAMWDAPTNTHWTVKRIHRELGQSYEHEVAYTTVMTTVNRLWEKGLISRRKGGLAYSYIVRCSQREFEEIQIRKAVESIGSETLRGVIESAVQA